MIKDTLIPVNATLNKYQKLKKESTASKMAVKLAKESYFGEEVLRQCTVMGCRQYPGLPIKELNELKQTMFGLFPIYWTNNIGFDTDIWSQCVTAIGQLCKRLRSDALATWPITNKLSHSTLTRRM